MKKSEFPEKAYEELFFHELLMKYGYPGRAPFFIPSQQAEKGLGYDLCFVDNTGKMTKRKVMLIQFKVASEYSGKNRFCLYQSGGWIRMLGKTINTKPPFYKFDIYKERKSGCFNQHNQIIDYINRGVDSFYAAPLFIKYSDLYNNYINKTIIDNSAFIPPFIKLNPGGRHHIEYNKSFFVQRSNDFSCGIVGTFKEILQKVKEIELDEFKEIILKNKSFETDEKNNADGYSCYYIFI